MKDTRPTENTSSSSANDNFFTKSGLGFFSRMTTAFLVLASTIGKAVAPIVRTSVAPVGTPTTLPSIKFNSPTQKPTTGSPSFVPSVKPVTNPPSANPTSEHPSQNPTTDSPSFAPSGKPVTSSPSANPTTNSPTLSPGTPVPTTPVPTPPAKKPTFKPTSKAPTSKPTTDSPSENPTYTPIATSERPTTNYLPCPAPTPEAARRLGSENKEIQNEDIELTYAYGGDDLPIVNIPTVKPTIAAECIDGDGNVVPVRRLEETPSTNISNAITAALSEKSAEHEDNKLRGSRS